MKAKKFLIFDAGPIISLTMNGLLPILEKLKQNFKGEFIITPQIKEEVIDKPLKIKKYKFEGIRVTDLIEKGILKMSSEFVSPQSLEKETSKIMKLLNSSFTSSEKIELIQKGEASCIAFANLCNCENVIVVDERTIRMMGEAPENQKKIMENKLHARVDINQGNLKVLKNIKFIRSSELIYIAYKKNLLEWKKDKTTLEALLYALKYSGTAISSRDIEAIKSLA